MKAILEKIKAAGGDSKITFYNMRQEPVVYINGTPYAPRAPEQYVNCTLDVYVVAVAPIVSVILLMHLSLLLI